MMNINITDNIQIDGTETEKVTDYEYQRQEIAMKSRSKARSFDTNNSTLECFCKVQRTVVGFFLGRQIHHESKKKGLQPVCYTSHDIRMPNTISYKNISM